MRSGAEGEKKKTHAHTEDVSRVCTRALISFLARSVSRRCEGLVNMRCGRNDKPTHIYSKYMHAADATRHHPHVRLVFASVVAHAMEQMEAFGSTNGLLCA